MAVIKVHRRKNQGVFSIKLSSSFRHQSPCEAGLRADGIIKCFVSVLVQTSDGFTEPPMVEAPSTAANIPFFAAVAACKAWAYLKHRAVVVKSIITSRRYGMKWDRWRIGSKFGQQNVIRAEAKTSLEKWTSPTENSVEALYQVKGSVCSLLVCCRDISMWSSPKGI